MELKVETDIYSAWAIDWRDTLIIFNFNNVDDYDRFIKYAEGEYQQWGTNTPKIIVMSTKESKVALDEFLSEVEDEE